MDGLKNYREKLKSIEKLVDKMESGELSIHELVEMETLTRELHERSIILKYKAFEESVKSDEPIVEEIEEEELTEVIVEEPEPEVEEKPALDFSMFDGPQSEEEEEEEEEMPVVVAEKEIEKPAPVVEKQSEPEVKEVKAEEKRDPVADEPMAVMKEKGTSFLDRLSIIDNSISAQLAGRKIETLSGAFGINERLHYINDLFDGSGEAFSDAIKTLDSQQNLDQASAKVEELAFKNSWNPEEEVVLEFLAIIKRRYA